MELRDRCNSESAIIEAFDGKQRKALAAPITKWTIESHSRPQTSIGSFSVSHADKVFRERPHRDRHGGRISTSQRGDFLSTTQ